MDPKDLTFSDLRVASLKRCYESFHPLNEWSPTDWATACAGEMGEACNLIKKLRRGDKIPLNEIGKELADTIIYIDLLAARLGLDLNTCVIMKFNEVSDRVKSSIRL